MARSQRIKILTFAILLLSASAVYAAEVLDVEFKDTSDRQLYHTTTLSRDLILWYGREVANVNVKVLLIETPILSDKRYKMQNNSLNRLGHEVEEFQVMFVTACTEEEYHDGYHTTREAAIRLSSNKGSFRVRLLNSTGRVLKDKSEPVSTIELRRWLIQKP